MTTSTSNINVIVCTETKLYFQHFLLPNMIFASDVLKFSSETLWDNKNFQKWFDDLTLVLITG